MVLFLHGQDDFLVGRRKQALAQAFTAKYTGGEVFVFDFQDAGRPEDVKRALEACEGGLFATEKIIVFLRATTLPEGSQKLLATFLKDQAGQLPERTILLFVETGKFKKTDILAKALLKHLDKEEVYDAPEGTALRQLVQKELARINPAVTMDARALPLFLALTGDDTAMMMTELEKLATFRSEGVITSEDITLLLPRAEEENIWGALDALGRGRPNEALILFRREAEKGEGVYPVLSMCAWQIRRLLAIREVFDHGIRRPSDIASATKLPPFTVQKSMAVIQELPLSRLKKSLALLSDIDTALKQGKADPEVSLDLFVWKF